MKITKVAACTCVVPLEKGIAFSTRAVQERHYTVVRVHTDVGVEGIGFCYSGHKAGHLATIAIRDLLRDVVVGKELGDVDTIWNAMYRESLLHGRRGVILRAISAIDIALWDAIAKNENLPLHRYLGGSGTDLVPAYASGGYYLPGKTLDKLEDEMQSYLDLGFRAVKIKVGKLSVADDAARVKAAREAVGAEIPVFLDANNAWPDTSSAIKAILHFEKYNPGWIEEPLMPDDIAGHAAIAAAVQTPVATGEIHATLWDFNQLVQQKAASILQADAGVCGGITEWRKIAAMAAANGVSIAPHWLQEVHVHLVASTPNATWLEYFTDHKVINLGQLFSTSLKVKPGGIVPPESSGLGIELDEDAVNRHSVDGWH